MAEAVVVFARTLSKECSRYIWAQRASEDLRGLKLLTY